MEPDTILGKAPPGYKLCHRAYSIYYELGESISKPQDYSNLIFGKVDVLFEDVASKDQIDIFIRNAECFLKEGGDAMISIKSQSIDVTKDPREIYKQCLEKLSKHFEIVDKVELDPYEKFHLFVVLKYGK